MSYLTNEVKVRGTDLHDILKPLAITGIFSIIQYTTVPDRYK